MSPPDLPRLDQAPAHAEPRVVQFRIQSPQPSQRGGFLGRRGFLAVLSTGAMTLGVTMLGWLPLARPARAAPGTEFLDCGRYGDGQPGGPICTGAPYSPDYCGEDKWFIEGCFSTPEGQVCYEPAPICRANAETNEGRNAWRWEDGGVVYRCADGRAYRDGAPNPEVLICSARLSPASLSPTPTPSPTPSSTPPPTPRPTWTRESSPVPSARALPPLPPLLPLTPPL